MPSIDLPPNKDSIPKRVVASQIRTKPRRPPASISFANQTAIITGSNVGIGLECARQMLALGLSHLILAVRRLESGEKMATTLRQKYPKVEIEVWSLDMASYDSVKSFAEKCKTLSRLDIAILNAGLVKHGFNVVGTGHEEVFQVNYLSTALLAYLLLPMIKTKRATDQPGRLSIVGSGLGLYSKFSNRNADPLFPSFDDSTGFDGNERYSLTKTLLMMFVLKFSEQVSADEVIVNVVDPGLTAGSSLSRSENVPALMRYAVAVGNAMFARSLEEGSWTYIDAVAVKGTESHGSFCSDWVVFPFHRMMYTDDGKKVTEKVWKETMDEIKKHL